MRSRHVLKSPEVDNERIETGYYADKRALDAKVQRMFQCAAESAAGDPLVDDIYGPVRAAAPSLPPVNWRTVNWGFIAASFISLALWWALVAVILPALRAALDTLILALFA